MVPGLVQLLYCLEVSRYKHNACNLQMGLQANHLRIQMENLMGSQCVPHRSMGFLGTGILQFVTACRML